MAIFTGAMVRATIGRDELLEFVAGEFAFVDAFPGDSESEQRGMIGREIVLHADHGFAELLNLFATRIERDAKFLRDFRAREIEQGVVDIVAAEVRIAVGGEHLVDVAFGGADELEDRDIEGAAAEIVNGDVAALLLVQTVGERRGGGLVDEPQNFEAGEAAGVFGGLALRVVEIRGDGDHGAIDCFAEVGFGPGFQFAQDEGGNLGRRERFFAEADVDHVAAFGFDAEWEEFQFVLHVGDAAAHEALHGIDGAVGMRGEAGAGGIADENFSVLIDADDRGKLQGAVRRRDTLRLARLRIGVRDQAECGAQVDSNYASHPIPFFVST